MVFNATFNNISGYIVVVSFIGGGNRNTQRKASICRKSLSFHYEKYGFNYQRKQVGLSNTSFLTTERSSWQQMHLGLLYIYLCNQCLITTYVMCSILSRCRWYKFVCDLQHYRTKWGFTIYFSLSLF